MNRIPSKLKLALAALAAVAVLVGNSQRARAGWTGAMNGVGQGWASVTVSTSVLRTNTVKTVSGVSNPSAAIPPTSGYQVNGELPKDASVSTIARVKGGAGYVWTATTTGYNGDKSDNEALDARVNVTPADCAELDVQTTAEFAPDGSAGTITVNGTASDGTALLLRGFEYHGLTPPLSVEDLQANGSLKWDVLLVGPFELNSANCTAVKVPFTTADTNNLYFVVDGVAKSKAIAMTCPSDVVFGCADPVVYPQPQVVGGCGAITLTYDPPAESLPAGVTTVTVTATDQAGSTAHCTFVADNSAKGIPLTISCPANVVFGCSDPLTYPSATVSGGCGAVTVSYNPPANALPVGTNLVTVIAKDSTGRTAQCTFTATRNSFTFGGFEEPLRCTNGGNCDSPAKTLNAGCVLPIEFKTKCGNSLYTTGTPTLVITKCPSQPVLTGTFRLDGGEWEYDWNTKNAGKGSFKIDVTLQDGSHQIIYVKLK